MRSTRCLVRNSAGLEAAWGAHYSAEHDSRTERNLFSVRLAFWSLELIGISRIQRAGRRAVRFATAAGRPSG
jgi:hypothetical protein